MPMQQNYKDMASLCLMPPSPLITTAEADVFKCVAVLLLKWNCVFPERLNSNQTMKQCWYGLVSGNTNIIYLAAAE